MNVRCVPVAATLSARGEDGLTTGMWSHLVRCPRCDIELRDHRELVAAIGSARATTYPAPADIYHRVMHEIGPSRVPHAEMERDPRAAIAATAAIATATATAVAGAAMVVMRHRQRAV